MGLSWQADFKVDAVTFDVNINNPTHFVDRCLDQAQTKAHPGLFTNGCMAVVGFEQHGQVWVGVWLYLIGHPNFEPSAFCAWASCFVVIVRRDEWIDKNENGLAR